MSSINNLPLDIWREILVRLPAESLMRARAVSKRCRAVIDDPSFVREHTNNSSSKIIIQNRTYYTDDGSCYSLDLEALINFSKNGHQATPLDLDFISDSPEGLSLPVAECNGLVLTEKPLAIWNPLTHERLDLPRGGFKKYVKAFGLGSYDDDYKVVVILRNRETYVYSLKPDSWRSIMNCPFDGDLQGPFGPGVFVCGALNWLSIGEGGAYEDKIVALDLGTEKYSRLQMPHQTRRNTNYKPGMLLKCFVGCLALCDSGFPSYLDVWVMKVYGDEDSWTKFFSIEKEQNSIPTWRGLLRPVAFIMKERLVFLQDDRIKFFVFDVETKNLKMVNIDGLGTHSCAQQMLVGTIFNLHANCGGVRKKVTKKRKIMSCTRKKKKNKKSSAEELVFCLKDANGEFFEMG